MHFGCEILRFTLAKASKLYLCSLVLIFQHQYDETGPRGVEWNAPSLCSVLKTFFFLLAKQNTVAKNKH